MKKLSRNEMKNVIGGKRYSNDEGGSPGCKIACVKVESSGQTTAGTCSAGSIIVSGTTVPTCDCSVIGGTGC